LAEKAPHAKIKFKLTLTFLRRTRAAGRHLILTSDGRTELKGPRSLKGGSRTKGAFHPGAGRHLVPDTRMGRRGSMQRASTSYAGRRTKKRACGLFFDGPGRREAARRHRRPWWTTSHNHSVTTQRITALRSVKPITTTEAAKEYRSGLGDGGLGAGCEGVCIPVEYRASATAAGRARAQAATQGEAIQSHRPCRRLWPPL
jgi:hypothetical protein